MRKNIYLLFLLFFIFSCNENELKEVSSFSNVKEFINTDFEEKNVYASDELSLLYKINDLIIYDTILIACTKNKEKPISLINKYNLELIGAGGCYGKGPGEQLYFYNFSNIQNSNDFWVSDPLTKRITNYNIDSLMVDTNYCPNRQIEISRDEVSTYSPVYIDNQIFTASFGNSRLYVCDTSGLFIKEGGIYPLKRDAETTSQINASVYYGNFDGQKNINGEILFVKINMYSPIIEFYDSQYQEIVTLVGPDLFSPKYTVANTGEGLAFAPDKSIKLGHIDVFLTDKFVYTLYSGKENKKDKPAINCNIIYQFDRKGNPKNKYILDKEVIRININEKENLIYGGAADGTLYVFPIK